MSEDIFSLLSERWLPVRARSGARSWIAPHEIDAGDADDPFVAPDWGRADFDAATEEFLIGLLATAYSAIDEQEWRMKFRHPPRADELRSAFAPFAAAFSLIGDGPRFMQDFDELDAEPSPVSGLLIEAPGANTEKENKDLFQKRGRAPALGLPAAAMALFTLQTYAPSGGAGHRTSLRGGGPLTTLALPRSSGKTDENDTLWRRLWMNVTIDPTPALTDLSKVFPWLAPTITSEGKRPPLTADDLHPLAAWWGMPRRIRLDIENAAAGERCAITGESIFKRVAAYRTRPWGMNYGLFPHPLSPMYRQKPASEWLYLHPQPGGLSYRNWIDMALAGGGESLLRRAAPVIVRAGDRMNAMRLGATRLRAVGYDMDNMKARGFVEAEFPLFDSHAAQRIDKAARDFVDAAGNVASLVAGAIGAALAIEGSEASRLGGVREAFFAATEQAFFASMERLARALDGDADDLDAIAVEGKVFLEKALRPEALQLFDQHAPLVAPAAREAERIVRARLGLVLALAGHGKRGAELYKALQIAPPEKKITKKEKAARAGRKGAKPEENADVR